MWLLSFVSGINNKKSIKYELNYTSNKESMRSVNVLFGLLFLYFLPFFIFGCSKKVHPNDRSYFCGNGNDMQDDSEDFMRALSSDKSTIYFKSGTYLVKSSKVNSLINIDKRLIGLGKVIIIDLDHGTFIQVKSFNISIDNIEF